MKKVSIISLIFLFSLSLLPQLASATYTSPSAALQPGTLIKANNDSVYYLGADGKRYVFPNEKTYKTWYIDFNLVVSISSEILGEIQIGGNVTYRPGERLVKITTDPKVYWVDKEGTLRWVKTETIAKELWGNSWYTLIDDVPDPFFINYKVGLPLETPTIPVIENDYAINEDKALSREPDPTISTLGAIELTGYASSNKAILSWTPKNFTASQGFKVVKSTQPDPVYPGNDYHYLADSATRSDSWEGLNAGTYYFRVCEYLGGKCGIYSNNLIVKIAGTVTDNTNGSITLTASWSAEKNKVILQWKLVDFYSAKGFKVVYAKTANPVYPGNEYHYLSDPAARSDYWTDLTAGTYHFRVCEYLGSSCGKYSNDVSVTVPGTVTDNSTGTIKLTGSYEASLDKVLLNWSVTNMYSDMGFKVVYAPTANPVYPGNEYHYLSDPAVRADKWYDLAPGTYHFRVCEYLGGKCGIYSNDLTVTIADTTNVSINKIIGAVFTYDNEPMSSSKIDNICDSQTDSESLVAIQKWFHNEAAKYNVNFNLSFNCKKTQINIPENMRDYYFCGPEGCITLPVDYTKVSSYLITEYPELQNYFENIVIHYSSTPKQFYNLAADDIYIFTQPVETEPFGLYGYSTRTIAHEIAHKLGAFDKYGDINRACQINPETGLEYSGYDIMCHRISESGGYSQPSLNELLITEPTAKEIGWIN